MPSSLAWNRKSGQEFMPDPFPPLTTAGKNTLKNAIENAALQGKKIIIDARNVAVTPEAAAAEIGRAHGNIGGLKGRVTVLTTGGAVAF